MLQPCFSSGCAFAGWGGAFLERYGFRPSKAQAWLAQSKVSAMVLITVAKWLRSEKVEVGIGNEEERNMTGYHLGVVHGALVSRSRAAEAWAEADRIEAMALHEGVLDALKKIGWIVDIDDSEADVGKTRWLLWAKDADDAERIVEGTPLGYLGLLKQVAIDPKNESATREWLDRVLGDRRDNPKPPAAGNILERLLEMAPKKELVERLGDPDAGDAERVLISWAILRNLHLAIKEDKGQGGVERWEDLHPKMLRTLQGIRRCDVAGACQDDMKRQLAAKRAFLEEWGIDPNA